MQQLNAAVDLEHRSPEQVIRQWRRESLPKATAP
jgi:glycine betaine/choline ABC-type transport system substrate-binding protein